MMTIRDLEPLLNLSRRLTGQLDLDELLGSIAHAIVDTLPAAEAASLWLYDEQRNELVIRAWAGHDDEALSGLALSPDASLVGLVYRSGQPRIMDDTASEPAFEHVAQPALDTVRSVLGVPLLIEDRPIGVLFADNFSRPKAFAQSDLRLLQSLAGQVAAAIENARLHAQVQQKVKELGLLLDTATAASSTLELDRILLILVEKMATSVGATFCRIALLDEKNETLTIRAASAIRDLDWDPGLGRQYALTDAPWHRQVIETGETVVLRQDDPSAAVSGTECRLALSEGIHSALLIPLAIGDHILGVVSLGEMRGWQRTPITADRVRLCQAMADRAAAAIENARLFEALRESEERHRSLFEGVPVGLCRTTPEGQILDANPAIVHMLGYPDRETFLSLKATDLYENPEDRVRWQALVEREGIVRGFETQAHQRDGTSIWVRDTTRAVRDTSGRTLYYEGTWEDISERKQAELAVAEERSRIARDTHDGIIQELSSLALGIDFCIRQAESDPAMVRLELVKIQKHLRHNIRELRHIILALQPVDLEKQELVNALEHYVRDWGERTGIQTHVSSAGQPEVLPLKVQTDLWRVMQESLNNVHKHAAAHQVWVTLDISPAAVSLIIRDDGQGFDMSTTPVRHGGLGLISQMQQRARAAGSRLEIHSEPGRGTEVRISIPRSKL